MKAVFGAKQPDPQRASKMTNCHLIIKHDEQADYLFYFPDPKAEQSGDAFIDLSGYLICPIEMFSPRQLRLAKKKYAALKKHSTVD